MRLRALFAIAAAASLAFLPAAWATLTTYDAAIAADHGGGAGPLPYAAINTTSVSVDGSNSAPFDFGATSGSATIEFILQGDPAAGGRDGFLAVGSNGTFSLRYEQWDDTGQLGFTHGGVADYLFPTNPASPTTPTHVAYQYDSTTSDMSLYLDGAFIGSTNAPGFLMPSGAGHLGNNAGLSEGMVGTIDRVTVYDQALSPGDITAHANAWLVPEPSSLSFLGLGLVLFLLRRRH